MKLQVVAILVIVCGLLSVPAAALLDRATGVSAYAMQEISPPEELPASLEEAGLVPEDSLADKLSMYGTPGPATVDADGPTRFVFVPEDRIVETDLGTLVVFDRTANEELLQAKTLYNIAWLLTAADLLGGFALFTIARLRRRRLPESG